MNDFADKLGFAASFFSIIPFIPQILKLYKEKGSEGISVLTYVLLCNASILWCVYGIFINSIPLILTNIIILILEIIVIILKLKKEEYK